jgi:hypothetical protein
MAPAKLASDAPIQDFDVLLGITGITIDVRNANDSRSRYASSQANPFGSLVGDPSRGLG